MTRPWKKVIAASLILPMTFLPMLGCSGSGSRGVDASEASMNQVYVNSLVANLDLDHPDAQVPADLFAEVKHFDLVASGEPKTLTFSGATPYVIYHPAAAFENSGAVSIQSIAQVDEGIPGYKANDVTPVECSGLTDAALKDCLDREELSAAPATAHISYFDAEALAALLGDAFVDALINKVIDSKLAHVDAATRSQLTAQLTDFIDDAPAHVALDLAEHQIFEREGYKLVAAILTDDSHGYVDEVAGLDRHSTLKIQLSKELNYTRSGHSELDDVFRQYLGSVPQETYLINLQVLIHLNSLHGLRQQADPLVPQDDPTHEEELAQLEREWEAVWVNKSLDANILKYVAEHPDVIQWESSEYVLSFQVSPDNITEHLEPILSAALQSGDGFAYNLIEHHINAQTAIITGGPASVAATLGQAAAPQIRVFYQVSRPRGGDVSPLGYANGAGVPYGWDYVMLDAAGNRVAIRDPASGNLVMAEERSKFDAVDFVEIQPLWTKSGACQGHKGDWAYWPSRVRTGNFGRGINWILTESLLHNQVGDYKNIRWYQSFWKANAQTAIKSGMWLVKNYLKVQLGGAGASKYKSDYVIYYILEVLYPMLFQGLAEDTGHGDGRGAVGKSFKIAGYGFRVSSLVLRFFWEASLYSKDQTFAAKAGTVVKGAAIGFIIDRVADGLGQTLDVTVTGWQDYSDSSHYGCFDFSY